MPDPITWYTVPRTVDDLETIMEAIDAKILTHNQDPSSHGQTGESLDDHRVEDELDHPFGSIDLRHLVDKKILAISCFESLDGWDADGIASAGVMAGRLQTAPVANEFASISCQAAAVASRMNPAKNPFFQTTVILLQDTEQIAYILAGVGPGVGDNDKFGFKIVDDNLWAYWTKSGVVNTQAIAGITVTDLNVYRAFCDNQAQEIYFYVNGVLKYTATANYPDTVNPYLFEYYIETTENVLKRMYMVDFLFMMDR